MIDEELFLSSTIITMFRESLMNPDATGLKINTGNNRVPQKPNDRTVEYYNIYKSDEPVPEYNEIKHMELTGHYEKVRVKEPFYFYVD